jgi:multicomponent Na+:H+ antiporter subunit G
MMRTVAGLVLILGAVVMLLAGIGAVRFQSTFARIHATAKAQTLGVLLIGIGVALAVRTSAIVATAVLVVVLQLIAGPIGSQVLGRSVYRRMRPRVDTVDELADAEGRPSRIRRDTRPHR